MVARYSVNRAVPYFATLNEAREHAVLSDTHHEAGVQKEGYGRLEWVDSIYCDDRHIGWVGRLEEPEDVGTDTLFRWIALDDDGSITWSPMYADGSLLPDSGAPRGTYVSFEGATGVTNGDKTVYFRSRREALTYAYGGTRAHMDVPDSGLRVPYTVVDEHGDTVGHVVLSHKGEMMYGSAEDGWWVLRPNGTVGHKTEWTGGPSVEDGHGEYGSERDFCDEDGLKELKRSVALRRQRVEAKLTDAEKEELAHLLDFDEVRSRSAEEQMAMLVDFTMRARGRMRQDMLAKPKRGQRQKRRR